MHFFPLYLYSQVLLRKSAAHRGSWLCQKAVYDFDCIGLEKESGCSCCTRRKISGEASSWRAQAEIGEAHDVNVVEVLNSSSRRFQYGEPTHKKYTQWLHSSDQPPEPCLVHQHASLWLLVPELHLSCTAVLPQLRSSLAFVLVLLPLTSAQRLLRYVRRMLMAQEDADDLRARSSPSTSGSATAGQSCSLIPLTTRPSALLSLVLLPS